MCAGLRQLKHRGSSNLIALYDTVEAEAQQDDVTMKEEQ
jgi:hypothetical protein